MTVAAEVLFPPLSKEDPDSVGVLSSWFVRDGERVAEHQVLGEVQVDKVAAEVVAPVSGTVHLLVVEDAEVQQGSLIDTIDDAV
jgi:pyruvate/2-oxoglutarate dehydrogenase complex dihydrolipoamide acyltransferase (E2) component